MRFWIRGFRISEVLDSGVQISEILDSGVQN